MVDESHTFAAETLETICYGVLANIPYRFFFSGTQTRGDGTEKLLQSIIGQTVHVLTTREAVEGGFICPHDYRIVSIESSNPNFNDPDALSMKRAHFLKNRNICAFIAKLANAEATTRRRQTLVLVEELEQIAMLVPLLQVPYEIAHSEKKAQRLQELGIQKVTPNESVEKFNKGEALILVGTSCISTGTNIYPTHNTVNWQGGASEIRTKQGAVGRSVRLGNQNPYENRCQPKPKATIWDFCVYDCDIMVRHLEERLVYYSDSGSEIKEIKLSK
jgi:superfamily II DNA or RNA helicase